MAITALAALGGVEGFHQRKVHLFMARHHELGNTLSIVDGKRVLRQVDEHYANLAPIVGIDSSGSVEHGKPVFQGQSTAGAHLSLKAFGQRDVQPSRDEPTLHRTEHDGFVEVGTEVHSRTLRSGIGGEGLVPPVDDFNFQHGLFLSINDVQNYIFPIKQPSFLAENFVGFILFSNFADMEWMKLISNKRLGQEHRHTERHDDRTEFKRDYDRLIFSAPFRRLQNKTQVFPLPGSIFVHNRLTHSLEVASVGMSLGNDVAQRLISERHPELRGTLFEQIGQIVSTACLAHDLGNPPFGHSGEKAIQTFFSEGEGLQLKPLVSAAFWDDITHFEGNANAFRLLTHQFKGRRTGGFVMTYSTLASIVKYPYASSVAGKKGKFGFFQSEQEYYRRIADEMGIKQRSGDGEPLHYARHPLVFLVEAADDICYEIMDIEDAHKLKIISYEETEQRLLDFFDEGTQGKIRQRISSEELQDPNEKIVYLRACVIGKLENECVNVFVENEESILNGTFTGSLIDHIHPIQREAYRRCAELSERSIYHSRPVLDVELSGYKIMGTLLKQMTDAVIHPERYYSQQLIRRVSSQYDIQADNLEARIMAVIDYISGMTDVYALDVYQKINGISLPIV